jgi:hypothetical protein
MAHAFLSRLTILSVILWVVTLCGCGASSVPPADRAERAVEQFLDAWSRGENPEKFASADQPLSGTDPDWENGYRLVSSLTIERKPVADQPDHVQCRVALSLRDPSGKQLERQVVYDVQVGERTVIRRVSP